MPHLTVEYSRNLTGFPEAQVLTELNQAVTSSPEVLKESDLKTRIVTLDSYAIGTAPDPRAFVHAQLRLLSGYSPVAWRQKVSKRKLDPARTVFDDFAGKYLDIYQESGEKWTAAANL